MKKMTKRSAAILGAVLLSGLQVLPAYAEAVAASDALCSLCSSTMENGICFNHETLEYEVPAYATDPMTWQTVYEIENAGELMWFAEQVNNGQNTISAFLAEDIDLSDVFLSGKSGAESWTAIGHASPYGTDYEVSFEGTLNGCGHVISGIKLEDTNDGSWTSVFGLIGTNGKVMNLGIEELEGNLSQSKTAGLATVNKGSIENCYIADSRLEIHYGGSAINLADLVVENYGSISNCFTALVFSLNDGLSADQVNLWYSPLVTTDFSASYGKAITNSYVEQDDRYTKTPDQGVTIVPSGDLSGGALCYVLNEGQTTPAYEQKLSGDAVQNHPALIPTEMNVDYTSTSVYRLQCLDETGTVLFSTYGNSGSGVLLPEGNWQYMAADGSTQEVTGNVVLTADVSLTRATAACEHSNQREEILTAATCMAPGLSQMVCNDCGQVLTQTEIPQAAHAFTNFVYQNDASCVANGNEVAACDYGCGTTESRAVEGTQTAHSFTNYVYQNNATCTANGTEIAVCDYGCGTTDERPAEGTQTAHSFTNFVYQNDATCTADGSEVAACDYGCGETTSRVAEGTKTEHSFSTYTYNNDATCTADGTETAVCDYGCGETTSRIAEGTKTDHSFTVYTFNNDATCMADGTETASCDFGCGETTSRTAEGTKTAHSFSAYTFNNDATCMADGTETALCDYGCETDDTRAADGTKLAHSFSAYTYNNDATCMVDGTETAVCDYGCGTEDAKTAEGTKLAHSYSTYTYNNDATCMVDGTETANCDHGCGTTDTRTVPGTRLAHSFSTYTYNNDATCLTDGTETAICDHNCGTTDTRTAEGTKVAHSFGTYTYNNDATCLVDGTETASCTYGCQTTDTRTAEGTKVDHSFGTYTYNNDATCLADGTETAGCAYGCGTTDTRTAAGTKAEHLFETYTYNNDATCTADGTETASCTYGCGTTDTRTVAGTAKGHTFVNGTCTECGETDANIIPDTVTAVISDSDGQSGELKVYRESITLKAPEGYYIKAGETTVREPLYADGTDSVDSFGTATEITVLLQTGDNQITYYLRRITGGQVVARLLSVLADIDAPVTDLVDGRTYCIGQTGSVTDTSDVALTVNGTSVEMTGNTVTFTEIGTKEIIFTDLVGNSTTVNVTVAEHDWNEGTVTIPATCTQSGERTLTCSRCGQTKVEEIAKTPHTYVNGFCTICGEKDPNHIGTGVAASIVNPRSMYPGSITFKAPEGYSIYGYNKTAGQTVPTDNKAASDTLTLSLNDGPNELHYFLQKTDGSGEAERSITVYSDGKAPVITGADMNAVYCLNRVLTISDEHRVSVIVNNGAVELSDQKLTLSEIGTWTIKAVDEAGNSAELMVTIAEHDWDDGIVTKAATCTTVGEMLYTCRRCGETKTEETEKAEHSFVNGVCTVCGEKDGTYDVRLAQATASSTFNGWYGKTITLTAPEGYEIRGGVGVRPEVPADFAEDASITLDLADGQNSIWYELRSKTSGATDVKALSALSDQKGPAINITDNALTSITRSSVDLAKAVNVPINGTISAADGESGLISLVYLLTDHDPSAEELNVATWTAYPQTGYTIAADGKYVVFAKAVDQCGNTTIVNTSGVILDRTAPVITGAAENSFSCVGNSLTIQDTNTYTVKVNNDPLTLNGNTLTFTQAGAKTISVTDIAGNSAVLHVTVNADHTFDAGVITQAATCTAPGVKTYTCQVCGLTKTEQIAQLAHQFTNYVSDNNATCTADGTKTALCDYGCGAKSTITDPGTMKPHNYVNGVCTVGGEQDPSTTTAPSTTGVNVILGIEDYSQIIGIALLCLGAAALVAVILVIRKKQTR